MYLHLFYKPLRTICLEVTAPYTTVRLEREVTTSGIGLDQTQLFRDGTLPCSSLRPMTRIVLDIPSRMVSFSRQPLELNQLVEIQNNCVEKSILVLQMSKVSIYYESGVRNLGHYKNESVGTTQGVHNTIQQATSGWLIVGRIGGNRDSNTYKYKVSAIIEQQSIQHQFSRTYMYIYVARDRILKHTRYILI